MPFNLKYPIFQAPTGSVAGAELCAAVSVAGGMGAMGLTWTEPETARAHVRQVRTATQKPFQVNFALAFSPAALTPALEEGVPFVTFSWGDPADLLLLVRSFGARIGIQIVNLDGAKRALDLGADFLIAQGLEAGGHVQSTTPLDRLLRPVVEVAAHTPVIAAGGLATGADIARVLSAGAAAAMLGTRFVATAESLAHPTYKNRIEEAGPEDTSRTICFDGGWPQASHRVLRNPTLETWEAAGSPPPGHRPGEGDSLGLAQDGRPILRYEDTAPRQGMTGQIDEMCLYAGTGVGRITGVPSAAEVVETLYRDCLEAQTRT